jgi:hypothetical protein
MANLTVGTKLQSVKKNTVTATIISMNEKYMTAMIQLNDGTTHSYTTGTLKDKRNWRILDDEDDVVVTKKDEPESVADDTVTPTNDTEEIAPHTGDIDEMLLKKFTKKEQKVITSIYRDGTGYHVTVEKNGNTQFFHNKSLLRIGLAIRIIVKGE